MRKFISLFAAMLMVLTASAKVWNVSPTHCETEGDNAQCNIYRTLKADYTFADGDTLLLAGGEYDEPYSTQLTKKIVMIAKEGEKPVIKMGGYFQPSKDVTAIGIKFDHTAVADNGYCMYFAAGCTRLELQNCEFTGFASTCFMSWDTYALDSLIINNCSFISNPKSIIYDPNGCINNALITNCTFANNDASSWSAGIIDIRRKESTADKSIAIDHCTFYNNKTTNSDYGEVRPRGIKGVVVSNCIFAQSEEYNRIATRFSDDSGDGVVRNVITYNYTKRTNQWGHYDGATYTACSMGDPKFKDAANGDFTLLEGSPAIDYAGKDAGGNDITVTLGDPRWAPAPALEPATFYGATSFITEGAVINPAVWTAVEYNITRKADKTLAYELTWTGDVVGMVPQLKIGTGGFTNMAVEGKKATMNPADTYEDGAIVNVEFYLAYAGAAKSIPVAYTVGAKNEKPATPVEPVFYTISATANIEAAGTVTGAGKVQEGESVTVKATANAGYHFCGWKDGETNATRTFTATKDETFVALFRANVANPYAYALASTYDDQTKKLSVEYALNAPADKVEIVVYNGNDEIDVQEQAAEGLTVGKHTATISCDAFAPQTKLTWAVRVNGLSPLAPVQHGTQYSMYCPHGVAVDNNPESEYFGRILATESMHAVTAKTLDAYISGTEANGAGIYAFSPDFKVIASAEGKNVFNGGNTFYTAFDEASYKSSAIPNPYSPLRIRISDDGRIFATALDDHGVLLWEISQDLKTWTPLLSGALTDGVLRNEAGQYLGGLMPSLEVAGSGEDLKLLALSCNKAGFTAYGGKNYFVHEYKIGTATTLTAAPDSLFSLDGVSSAIVACQASLVYDGEGGYWLGNSRSGADQVQLAHLNAKGERDWYATSGGFYGGGGVMFKDGLLYVGKDRTNGTIGNFGIYTVKRDEQGVVTGLKEEFAVRCDGIGRNINDFAMDFGHNLFIVGNSNEKIEQFALPYDGENETPAAQKFAFFVGGDPTAITTISDELIPVEKVIRNGEVLIMKDGKIYNMMGQMVR